MASLDNDSDCFEQQWREALGDELVTPPSGIWDKISAGNDARDLQTYKKKAQFYKWVAGFAVLVSASLSIPGFFNTPEEFKNNDTFVAEALVTSDSETQSVPVILYDKEVTEQSSSELNDYAQGDTRVNGANFLGGGSLNNDNSDLFIPSRKEALLATSTPVVKEHIYHVPYVQKQFKRSDKTEDDRYWAGLGLGSSTFDPNYQMSQSTDLAQNLVNGDNFINQSGATPELVSESMMVGTNKNVGLMLGMRVKNRLTLEGGLQYAQAQVLHQTNTLIESVYAESAPLTSESVKKGKMRSITNSQQQVEYRQEEMEMSNVFDFAAIPVKAGYILMDRRFSMRLNAGVITNFYLGNEQRELDDDVASFAFSPGRESSYRDVSFSGQAGFMLGYRLLSRMDFTLEPNYTQSFQSITKSTSNFNATPNGFGVMAGVRINFK